MKMTGLRAARGVVKDFLKENKKTVLSFGIVFALGIVIGIFVTISAAGGEFERVARADMEFGAVKVFFTTGFAVLLGYGVLLAAACAPAVAPVSLLSPAVLGYFFGKYMCLLVAVYGATGIVNLLVIYVPFFLVTFLSMTVAGARAARAVGCGRVPGARAARAVGCGRVRSSALVLLKVYGVNMAADFAIFVLVGAFVKVIVVGF